MRISRKRGMLRDRSGGGCRAGRQPCLAGGPLALVRDGDTITVDIAARLLHLQVDEPELAARRALVEQGAGYRPRHRDRPLSTALRAYAALATSADKGAVRQVTE